MENNQKYIIIGIIAVIALFLVGPQLGFFTVNAGIEEYVVQEIKCEEPDYWSTFYEITEENSQAMWDKVARDHDGKRSINIGDYYYYDLYAGLKDEWEAQGYSDCRVFKIGEYRLPDSVEPCAFVGCKTCPEGMYKVYDEEDTYEILSKYGRTPHTCIYPEGQNIEGFEITEARIHTSCINDSDCISEQVRENICGEAEPFCALTMGHCFCKKEIIIEVEEIFYRFEDNQCTQIEIFPSQKTSNDYNTLIECEENILECVQNIDCINVCGDKIPTCVSGKCYCEEDEVQLVCVIDEDCRILAEVICDDGSLWEQDFHCIDNFCAISTNIPPESCIGIDNGDEESKSIFPLVFGFLIIIIIGFVIYKKYNK